MLAADRWRLRMDLAGSVRELEATTCAELSRAAALLLALLLDPLQPSASVKNTEERSPPTGPQPVRADETPEAPKPTTVEAAPASTTAGGAGLTWSVGGGVLIDTGLLPSPELLAAVHVGVWFEQVSAALRFAAGLDQDVAGQGRVLARLSPRLALAEGCYRSRVTRLLEGRLCGTIEAGLMHAEPVDLAGAAGQEWVWAGTGAEIVGSVRLGYGFFLESSLSGSVPVLSPEFTVESVGPVHEPEASLRGSLQLVLTF
jgi:hypothetical protein